MGGSPQSSPSSGGGGMEPNLAGALAYLFIVAIIWLVMEPYNKDRFIRFHSFQSLFLGAVFFVVSIVLSVIPILGWILLLFLPLVALGLAILCAYKAYNKEMYKLPLLGDYAEKYAGA